MVDQSYPCKGRDLHEFGETVWVRQEVKGAKLGGRVREGRWLGVDEVAKGYRIYYPDTKKVKVERNINFKCDDTSLDPTPSSSNPTPVPESSTNQTAEPPIEDSNTEPEPVVKAPTPPPVIPQPAEERSH